MLTREHRTRALVYVMTALFMVGVASTAFAAPNTLNRDSIPARYKWDLTHIYPNWEAWQQGYDRLDSLMTEFAGLKGTLANGPEATLRAFQLQDELDKLSYKVYRYPQLQHDLNQRDSEIREKFQQVQILFAKFGQATSWFTPELLAIPWETMQEWIASDDEFAPYRHNIENTYRQQEHVLDEDKEELLSYFNQFSGTPADIHEALTTADMEYPRVSLNGEDTVTLTPGEYYSTLTYNRSQEQRKKAHEAFYGVYHKDKNTYGAIYNAILQRDWATAQARNYESTLEADLHGDNVPTEVYETLVNTVKAGTEPVKRYYEARRKALGLDEYHLYDGSVSVVDFDKKYEFDDITDWIVESVEPLGQDYQEQIKDVFKGGWIDVYESEGKATGAYQARVYGAHPYLLLNYKETMNDMFTVAHEVGHTMHTLLSYENQPFATANYTIFVAEVASTLNEALFLDYMFEKSDDPKERIALLEQAIDNIIGTFYTQTQWADFEWQAHQLAERGEPVTENSLRQLYKNIENEYYGDAVVLDSLYEYTWTRIGHFYFAPYYVYKYATCYASSAKLVKEITSGDENTSRDALDRYLTLLKSGGNDYPMEQLKAAGVDLSDPSTVQAVVDQLDELVTLYEQELAKL